MMTLRVLALSVLLVGAVSAQPQFKQLAGPPAEFPGMAPPDPALSATHSKSALLPVTLEKSETGQWTWRSEIPVEGEGLRFLVLSGAAPNAWNVTLRDPVNEGAKAGRIVAERRATQFGLSNNSVPADYYALDSLTPGSRQVLIESAEPGRGFLLIEGAGPARLRSHKAAFNQRVGQRIGLIANIYDRDTGADSGGAGSVGAAVLRVTTPDGSVLTSAMYDDGLHHDGAANDGVYGGDFLAERAGDFNAQVIVSGQDSAGNDFLRTAEHLIPIVEDNMSLQGQMAAGEMVGARRLEIRVNVLAANAKDHYRAVAEVWGTGGTGNESPIPVAWIGGMSTIRDGVLVLGLDTRWIAASGAREPFELHNLRIEDPDHFITLASAERMPLSVPQLSTMNVHPDQIVVDEEMLMGPRPTELLAAENGRALASAYTDGTGHKLLLVHGYCSSDVWGPIVGEFTNAGADSVFLDPSQSRSHDAFAQLIRSFGLKWNSYGIVAHSQGGAAALHLYTYYWSGLDNAGPGRLIQSVGTPYQGTALAGNLAALGAVFGQGCGTNSDLTYDGAAAWLAGIPGANRAKVNYYTTSFTENDFVYDYCSLATDLFLTDPDDGVAETAWAQLPGGVNQGHTTGQCHTIDMRDPAQYFDVVRNASMNANAAIGRPTVTTTAASGIGQYTATLNGGVNPSGASTTTGFDYGTTASYGSWIAAQTRSGSTAQAISASPSLSCGTLYHHRAQGTNAAGTSYGADLTFTTAACPVTRVIGLAGNLAFGNVPINATATATLTITNSGNATLTVSSITYPAGFGGAWSGTVAAGASQPVTVTFAPAALTSYGGTITVNADQTGGTATISASGTGTPIPGNGICGLANGVTFTSAPAAHLCRSGTPTVVSGSGPWSWSCPGSNGGTTADCSANHAAQAVPFITSAQTASGAVAQPFRYQITATNDPTSYSYGASGLPAWLVIHPSTGLISGTPAAIGTFDLTVTASSAAGTGSMTVTITIDAVPAVAHSLATGFFHTCALTVTGGVRCWGDNTYGQLGDGTSTARTAPVDVSGLASGVTAVAIGHRHSCALTKAGGLKCWGDNSAGQLGDGTTTVRNAPVDVSGLASGVTAVAAGYRHTCAVTSTGGLKCWGLNGDGQLGDTTTTDHAVPVAVSGLDTGFAEIAVGSLHSCARTTAGGVKCWGDNTYHQAGGAAVNVDFTTPSDVSGLGSGVAAVTAGANHACAVTTGGGLKCWGQGLYGQLGDNTNTVGTMTPVNVSGLTSGVASSAAGILHTCALTAMGGAKCWGSNGYGQLGDTTIASRTAPVNVFGLTGGVAAIAAGYRHSCARTAAGGVKCWGDNGSGQLGDGTTTGSTVPVEIAGFVPVALSNNAKLDGLMLSGGGTLAPDFASATSSYTATVANGVTSITVTATLADATATAKVNGAMVASGSASGPISLNIGSNAIAVLVAAQDGVTTRTYTVYVTRADASAGTGFAAGSTAVGSAVNATPTIISTLSVTCPASGAVLVSGSGESAALSTSPGPAFIGLAYSIARDSYATDNGNVLQSSALAVFNGDANRDFLNVRRVDSCTPGMTSTYRLTAYRTTPETSTASFLWNGRLAASEPRSIPGAGFTAGTTAIGSADGATPSIISTLAVTCPASGALLVGGSGESAALSSAAGTAFVGLAYSISRDSLATDNGNVLQSSALAVFNGDVNRDFLNLQRVDSCAPGSTYTYRLTGYRTTPDTTANSFVWNGRLTVSEPQSLPGSGFAAGTTAIASADNAAPTIVASLAVTCPASGRVMVGGSGESTALSSKAGTAFIGLAYSIARDSTATDNTNVVQSSALAVFNGDANRDFLNVQRVDTCTPGASSSYRLTAYRTTPDTSSSSFVWNGRLAAIALP